jgi:lipoyl-dependent peroxiredoxin
MTFGAAVWEGGIKDGKGAISTKSGALDKYPYGFSSRFEGKPGTNPEVNRPRIAGGSNS